jgi:hypothetical protein
MVTEQENEDEWLAIVYSLIEAIGGPRGKSIPEDVEHAIAEVKRLRGIVPSRWRREE